jgi:hypothetical protein
VSSPYAEAKRDAIRLLKGAAECLLDAAGELAEDNFEQTHLDVAEAERFIQSARKAVEAARPPAPITEGHR